MNRFRSLLLAAFALCTAARAQDQRVEDSIAVSLPVSKVVVDDTGDGVARFSGAPTSGRSGAPALPRLPLRVLLPPDADLSTVRVTIEDVETKIVPGDWTVEPAPLVATLSGKTLVPQGIDLENGRDPQAYQVDAYTPSAFVADLTKRRMRQWRIAGVVFTPYRYNPVKRELQHLAKGMLRIHFKRVPDYRMPVSRSSEIARRFRRQVESQVMNFNEMGNEYKNRAR